MSGLNQQFAKLSYGLKPVPGVQIPPSPPKAPPNLRSPINEFIVGLASTPLLMIVVFAKYDSSKSFGKFMSKAW